MILPDTLYIEGAKYQKASPIQSDLWRVLHEAELPSYRRITPRGNPEVRALFPNHYSEFGEAWQRLSRAMNPRISNNKWTSVYSTDTFITNFQGFGLDRANYILGTNLDHELPRVEALTTGGSLLKGHVSGSDLVVETLDVNNPPTLAWIEERPWFWTYAVSCDGKLQPRRFPQGLQPNGEVVPIVHPLIANPRRYTSITIPLWRVVRWPGPGYPDPFLVYHPI